MYSCVMLTLSDEIEDIKKEAKLDSFETFIASRETFAKLLSKMYDLGETENFESGYNNFGINQIYGKNILVIR